jgi:hypothetical protein
MVVYNVLCYRFLGRRSAPSGPALGRPLVSPASNRNIDAASPPDLTADVTMRANAHTEDIVTQKRITRE